MHRLQALDYKRLIFWTILYKTLINSKLIFQKLITSELIREGFDSIEPFVLKIDTFCAESYIEFYFVMTEHK